MHDEQTQTADQDTAKILASAMATAQDDVRKLQRQRERFKLHLVNTTKPIEVGDEMRGQWDGYVWTARVTQVDRDKDGTMTNLLASQPTRMGTFTKGPNRHARRAKGKGQAGGLIRLGG